MPSYHYKNDNQIVPTSDFVEGQYRKFQVLTAGKV